MKDNCLFKQVNLTSSTMKIRSLFYVYFPHFTPKWFIHSYVLLLNEYQKNEKLKSCLTTSSVTKDNFGSFRIITYFVPLNTDRNPLGKNPHLTDFAHEV